MVLIDSRELGPYRIVSSLGSGGMGEVFEAVDSRDQARVALKVLPAGGEAAGDLARRFRREGRIHQRLSHPNLVRILDTGSHGDLHYLVLELVDGVSLAQILKPGGSHEPRRVIPVLMALASGIHYLHEMDVTHRDLKPANVLISRAGAVKIADFGLATGDDVSRLTGRSQVVGTVAYLPPEVVAGGPAGPPADLFALGVMAFEMLAGRSPFRGETVPEIFRSVLEDRPPSLAEAVEGVPPALAELVERLLEKDPDRRMAALPALTVLGDLAAALGSFQKGGEGRALLEAPGKTSPATEGGLPETRVREPRPRAQACIPEAHTMPPALPVGEDELMAATARGDLRAYDLLVAKYQDMAWRIAYGYTSDHDEAADIVQNAFTRIFVHASSYAPRGHFRAYLRQVVVRLCMNHHRSRRPVDPSPDLDLLPAGQTSPSVRAARGEKRDAVRDAVRELPPRQRMVITLRYFDDLSYREIAQALRISEKAVEKTMTRARRNLEPILERALKDRSFSLA